MNSCLGFWTLLKPTEDPMRKFLCSCHVILSSILVGFWLYCRTFVGDCSNYGHNILTVFTCNPQHMSYTLPVDTTLILMMIPFAYSIIFKNSLPWHVLIASWSINIICVISCICIFNAYNSIYSLIIYIPLSFAMLRQNTNQYNELSKNLQDNKNEILKVKLESEANTKEVQHMMSNVTHDLKTVCSFHFIILSFSNSLLNYLCILLIFIANVRSFYWIKKCKRNCI